MTFIETLRRPLARFTRTDGDAAASEPPEPPFEPTPIMITPRTRLIVLIAIAVTLVLLAHAAPSVPRLLVLGATLALILSFPVRVLSRFMARPMAILVVMTSMIAVVIIGLVLLIPFVTSEISRFVKVLPDTADTLQARLRDVLEQMYRRGLIKDNPDTVLNNLETSLFDRAQAIAESILNNTLDTLTRSFSILITAFGVLFIATYLLIDVPKFKETFVNAFAHKYRTDAEQLWRTLGDSLSRYLAGLLISITFQGVAAMIGLYAIGIPYALILGVWMSATAVLPYIGAFLGAIPAVLIALSIGWETTVLTVILYVVVNQVDSNFVTPRVQGTAVRVHPVLIFISVIGGSEILGPLGAILAVPMLAVIRVLAEFFWVRLRVDDEEQETLLVAMSGSEMDVIEDDMEVKVDLERDDEPATATGEEPESGDETTEIVVSRQEEDDASSTSTNGESERKITVTHHDADGD